MEQEVILTIFTYEPTNSDFVSVDIKAKTHLFSWVWVMWI